MAYLLIRNSDQAKYGTVMNGLVSQFSMQNNQCPKTVTAATDILSNHRFDNSGVLNKKKWSQSKKNEDGTSTNKEDGSKETSFAQVGKDKTCYCCGKKAHISPECPQKSTITRGSSKIGWSALQIEWKESLYTDNRDAMSRMKNCILLDSDSTLSLFSNPELVENIRSCTGYKCRCQTQQQRSNCIRLWNG
jgi:hypothetical protein